ncbi:MAG TPA: tyrosine-type recombinase/integrase [Coriobacteriia bacterium]|nr:tyrosine-type recombinase/integrase [Coriobacteriia bacterium]
MNTLAPLIEAFFLQRLSQQRQASPNTIASYRDTFRLLLRFIENKLGKKPSDLLLADLRAPTLSSFLDSLESERKNCPRSRNARLAVIRSFFHYAATEVPEHSALIQRALAIPQKRFDRKTVGFLTEEEFGSLLAAPDTSSWIGRRDHALLVLAEQTGFRVSEIIGLTRADLHLERPGACVRCMGKGRKERLTPLRKETVEVLRAWLREPGQLTDPLFPSQRGGPMSRDAVEKRLLKYGSKAAAGSCPSLAKKRVSPHILRHTTAVRMLEAGIDTAAIALWLGHESIETTQVYLAADLAAKERALAKTAPSLAASLRYRPPDRLLAFLNAL